MGFGRRKTWIWILAPLDNFKWLAIFLSLIFLICNTKLVNLTFQGYYDSNNKNKYLHYCGYVAYDSCIILGSIWRISISLLLLIADKWNICNHFFIFLKVSKPHTIVELFQLFSKALPPKLINICHKNF